MSSCSASMMMNGHCQRGDGNSPDGHHCSCSCCCNPPSHPHLVHSPGLLNNMNPYYCRHPFPNLEHRQRIYHHNNSRGLVVPSLRILILHVVLILLPLTATVVNSADIGKYFTRSPQSIVAPPGDRVTFQCETNIPAEQVRWKLNGRFLHPANDTDIRITGTYLIVKVSKNRERYMQQVGDYQCVAEFGAEALTSLPAQLSIARMESFKSQENRTLVVVQGNSVAIQCDPPYSNPPPIIQFFKDGKSLETETAGNFLLTDAGVLLIQNATLQDSGTYWCSVTNHITSDTVFSSWATTLRVQTPRSMGNRKAPEFLVKPKSYIVVPKDGNATLDCVAIGNPPPFTVFRKLRAPSVNNLSQTKGNLHLINVGLAHEGEYVCEAYNGVGESVTTLSTIVLNSMPNITKEPMSLVVEEGGEATMDCATEGLPKPRVYWVFNGHNVHDDGNIKITDGGLRISQVEKKHAGLFQCFATNPMGTVTSPAELKVLPKMITSMANDSTDLDETVSSVTPPVTRHHHGENHHHKNNKFHRGKHKRRKHNKGEDMTPPSKPVMNRISDESVMVRWSVPLNTGYPIQFFKIQYKEVSKRNSRWMTIDDDIPPHIHSYEVRDLRVGHAYRFRIAAVYSNNDNKVGTNSEKFVLQKDSSMRRPSFVPIVTTVVPHNSTTIKLQWKHMRAEGGGLDGYFIYYREATTVSDYSKVTVLGSDTELHYITHLKPGTSYDIKIQAFNRAGASNFSSIVAAKTMGVATTEKPEEDRNRKKQTEIVIPDDVPAPPNDKLYVLLGCLFAGFWVFLCVACALCYKCKQKRAEEEAKYPCDLPNDIEAKTIPNGHTNLNGHALDGYLPNITSHLDEKETSFVERHHNNNRPISPSQLNSPDDLATFKSAMSLSLDRRAHHQQAFPEPPKSTGTPIARKDTDSLSRNNSLQRKKHHHNVQQQPPLQNQNHSTSLRRGPYMSCSSEDLDCDSGDVKSSKVFPKEHYKVSRKHSRKRNSVVDG